MSEYEGTLRFQHHRFGHADARAVIFVDPLQSGSEIHIISEGRKLELLPFAADVPYFGDSGIDPDSDADLESIFRFICLIQLIEPFQLLKGGYAGKDGFLRLIGPFSPERHNSISFILIDVSAAAYQKIRHFLEVVPYESEEILRLHAFGNLSEPLDVAEEYDDLPVDSFDELHFEIRFYRLGNLFRYILRKSILHQRSLLILEPVFVDVDAQEDNDHPHDEIHRILQDGIEYPEVPDVVEHEERGENEDAENEEILVVEVGSEYGYEEEERNENQYADQPGIMSDEIRIQDSVEHEGVEIDPAYDPIPLVLDRGNVFIVQGRRGRPDEHDLVLDEGSVIAPRIDLREGEP